jgi:hypothetical protein
MKKGKRQKAVVLRTYTLSAVISDIEVLDHVGKWSARAEGSIGLDAIIRRRVRMILVPPFVTSKEGASILQAKCEAALFARENPLLQNAFSIKGLSTMTWSNDQIDQSIVYFPVTIKRSGIVRERFFNHVKDLRKMVKGVDQFSWQRNIPPEFCPYIQCVFAPKGRRNGNLTQVIEESQREFRPVEFQTGQMILCVERGENWELFQNTLPSQEEDIS